MNTPLVHSSVVLTWLLVAAVVLSFAERNDIESVRRLLYNKCTILKESFVLVELPNTLYAGFCHTLRGMQVQSVGGDEIAFLSFIAPSSPGANPSVTPPTYTQDSEFAFQLDCLTSSTNQFAFRPQDVLSGEHDLVESINGLCDLTTLDRGQATALCENLCRGLAFTQGPPGTGKT